MDEDKDSKYLTVFLLFLLILFLFIFCKILYKIYKYNPEEHVFGNVYNIVNIESNTVLLQTDGRYITILPIKSCSLNRETYELGDRVVSYFKGQDKDGKKEYAMLHKKLCEKAND